MLKIMLEKFKKSFNFEYFSMWREIPLLFFIELTKSHKNKSIDKTNRVLIVAPCLIGEFVAAIPAISSYIKVHSENKIDLLITAQLEPLVKKIKGVNKTYVTKSAYIGREKEKVDYENQNFNKYDEIMILRISETAYSMISNIKEATIKTAFKKMFGYSLHLLKNLILGHRPKRWRTLNFEILNIKDDNLSFEEMFDFNSENYQNIKNLEVFSRTNKKIIVHTGTKWIMKKWPNERWIELLNKINKLGNFDFIFIGGNDDQKDYDDISSKLDFKLFSLINKVDLGSLPLVLKQADYFMGIDSGPSNMAHLIGLRSLTIYGPGPHMYMPTDPDDVVFDKTNGRGLWQLFFKVKSSYIKKISVDEVFEAFQDLVKKDIL